MKIEHGRNTISSRKTNHRGKNLLDITSSDNKGCFKINKINNAPTERPLQKGFHQPSIVQIPLLNRSHLNRKPNVKARDLDTHTNLLQEGTLPAYNYSSSQF